MLFLNACSSFARVTPVTKPSPESCWPSSPVRKIHTLPIFHNFSDCLSIELKINFCGRVVRVCGAVARVLASLQCGPGWIPVRWIEFVVVVGFCLAKTVFLWILQFSSLHKANISKFRFDQDMGPT